MDLLKGCKSHFQNGTGKHEKSQIQFHINGSSYQVRTSEVSIDTSLNTFIRTYAHLPGTKFMCLEGGCGACIVTASGKHPVTKEYRSWAINSCLTPVYSCDGLNITTIEGVGNRKNGYHEVQIRLAKFNGTQCGYCSPGMVMNMYSLLKAKNGECTMKEIENSFGGNICRCTGYRPILDTFKSLAIDADPKYKTICNDIEDLPKICPNTGENCTNGNCNCITKGVHLIFDDGKEWYKATDLNEIFDIWSKIGKKTYMLVAGNTAHGVYRHNPNIDIFIDINNVEKLHSHSINKSEVILSGNLSLTDAMYILNDASKISGFEYCKDLFEHIDLIANVPVRNAGTLAGNLSIKHSNHEFPSDLFLILTAVNAKLTIAKRKNDSITFNMVDYLKSDMTKSLITKITLKPLNPSKFKFKSYKVMPRAQNAHAYVNAAFLFEFNDEHKITTTNICFGGINPKFINAIKTEQYLIGKNPYSSDIFDNAKRILESELVPDWILPDACPEYRKNVALSLFYKFILATNPDMKLRDELKSGGTIIERPLSFGTHEYDTFKERWPLTEPVQKVEGLVQCSGEAQYINDIPEILPGQLWAAFVPATSVHSKILSIDATEALNIPGVKYFYSAKDIPGHNNFTPLNMMLIVEIEEIFCETAVKFHGQPVGMILADSFELANEAIYHVKVEYEKLEDKLILPTILDVYEKNATERFQETPFESKLQEKPNEKNIETTIEGRFVMKGQYHFTLEPQTTVCIPIEDGLDVFAATQWVDFVQIAISQCLSIPESSINMQVRRIGGGYGGKMTRNTQIACACALGAKLTNRPVRFVMSLESNMAVVGKRNGLISDYKVFVDKNGKIQKLINDYAQDDGCSRNEEIVFGSFAFFKNCYISDLWQVKAKAVITDSASNTWCRSPGTTEGIGMIENIMEHIAREIDMDPIDVRLANIPDGNKLRTLIPEFIVSTEFKERKLNIDNFNKMNRWRKRGIAITPMQYNQHFFGSIPVLVSIYHTDGTVVITHGGIECGQGINTKVTQIAAKTLGISMDYIKIKPAINYVSPNSGVTGGSMTSEAVCYATMMACQTLLERMKPIRVILENAKWQEITEKCYEKMIDLSATHIYKMSDMQNYITWGLSCAEIEVDILTGNFQLLRVDILEDTGESMSPDIDRGQVEGAFIMGLGYWLNESLVYDNNSGELLTNRTWNYKPPGAKDIPIDFRVTFLRNSPNPLSVLRSKATGEPSLCMSIVAIFALRYALESARKDAGILEKWFNLGAPTTIEQIFLATGTNLEQLKL